MYGWSTVEHTVEPDPGTIREDEGESLRNPDRARCNYCGAEIEGSEDGWYHIDD